MSRLYDRIMENFEKIDIFGDPEEDYEFLIQTKIDFWSSTVILADNIQQYYIDERARLTLDEKEEYYKSMPLCRPPLDLLFVEFGAIAGRGALGYHIRRIAESNGEYSTDEPKFYFFVIEEIAPPKHYWLHNLYSVTLDSSGKVIELKVSDANEDEEDPEMNPDHVNLLFLTISLMNCKNVELIDQKPSAGLSRKHERRTGEPLVTYKVLKVQSMSTVKHPTDLTQVSNKQQVGESILPLHIARGHFKDFRDGKGLFGKLKGVYWWDQHVRGSIENGAIIKDYDVQAPTATER